MNRSIKPSWAAVPPWIILGAVVVLVPIFFFWTFQNIRKQKESMSLLLLEKGAALIRSFEAGTRTGMMGMMGVRGSGFQLQRLLVETAQEPDIDYLLVTDSEGSTLAHSDPSKIGGTYGQELDLEKLSGMDKAQWRRVSNADGTDTFEVFRRFNPIHGPPRGMQRGRMPPQGTWPFDSAQTQPWTPDKKLVIFVGLDMQTAKEAGQRYIRQSVLVAAVLLLIGFAGIVLLFLAQAYRSTRTSLTRITAFSEKVVESMPIGLLALDRDGKVLSVNPAAEPLLRVSAADAQGMAGKEAPPPPLWDLLVKLGDRKKVVGKEVECPTREGRTIPLDVSISTMEGEEGAFLGHIILFRDLTEVQTLKLEIETGRRLASLGRLAAGVAHEIRNPLSSIKGFATYFKERYRDIPEDRGTAEIMVKEVDRLNRVISQLLEFARPMSVQKRPSSPQALIQHTLKMVQPQALSKEIRIRTGLPDEPLEIPMDMDKMSQVLLNLYLNSIEAMDRRGSLAVELRRAGARPGIEISVQDTGAGIQKEDLAQIFDPYFTTRASGTGLGLAIVHKIMESHQGEVKVESVPGRGTTVTLFLPDGDERESYEESENRSDRG
jgi:two-component system, NtrC family, sensor histidine kinase HydH